MGKKKNKRTMLIAALLAICMLPALALLKTSVFGKEKNAIITDNTARYDIVADLDGGKFELGTKPEFTKMNNGKWLHKYKPTILPTKLPKPVKDGYTFVGWTLEGETTPKPEYSIPSWNKKNINLTANWKAADSILLDGPSFNSALRYSDNYKNINHIKFIKGYPDPNGIDLSEKQDKSIMGSFKDGIFTIACEGKILANPDSSEMFRDNMYTSEITFDNFDTTNVTNMENMFYVHSTRDSYASLRKINGLNKFNTPNVTNMTGMFSGCSQVESLDVSSFDTSKVTSMYRMFEGCETVKTLDVSNFNTSNVEDMGSMFAVRWSGSKLENRNKPANLTEIIGLERFDTSNVWNMQEMFSGCTNTINLNVSKFDTSKVVFMQGMFNGCWSLASIDVSNFNTLNVINMSYMFKECSKLKIIDVSNFNTSNVTDMSGMFSTGRVISDFEISAKSNLSSIIGLENLNTDKVNSMSGMFESNTSLEHLNLDKFNTSKVTDMSSMFAGCSSLINLDLNHFNMTNLEDTRFMFKDCFGLSGEITISNHNIRYYDYMFCACSFGSNTKFLVKYISPETKILARNMVNTKNPGDNVYLWEDSSILLDGPTFNTKIKTLSGYSRIEFIKASPKPGIDVSAAQDGSISAYLDNGVLKIACIGDIYTGNNASNMFKGLNTITNIKFTNFNSSSATNMSYMFSACNSLLEIDLSKINTSSVTTMHDMFAGCKSIKSFDLSEFDTRNVTSLHGTFYDCDGLTNLDLNSLNTSKVTDLGFIVAECDNLKSVYMNILDVSKVTSIRHLLKYCRNLEHAALPRFDFSKIKDTAQAFAECDKLSSSITINGGATTAYEEMFYTCSTVSPAKFVVRYTDGYREKAQAMVNTKNRGSNVILVGPPSFMVTGNTFNSRVKGISGFANITSVRFEKGIVPSGVDLSAKTDGSIKGYISGNSLIVKSREDIFANINSSGMFKDFPVNSIIFGNFNTDYVEQMQSMFENCLQLTSIDVSGFNTSNVTNMKYMFKDCRMLANLDLSSFNTSNVEYMNTMFDDCNKLVNLNLDSFTTHSVIDMGNMFNRCSLLKSSITIKNPNITEYRTIFRGCSTASNAKFVVNYISPRTKEVAINMVATKSQNSNVVLGEEIALRCNKIRKGSNLINTESVNPNRSTTPKPSTQNKTVNITLINGPSAQFSKQVIQTKAGKIGDLPKPDLNPKYAGQFGGYYYDQNCTIPVKPNDIVTQDIELYAKW